MACNQVVQYQDVLIEYGIDTRILGGRLCAKNWDDTWVDVTDYTLSQLMIWIGA